MSKPSELAITLATASARGLTRDGWVYADAVRERLKRLGFDATAQQVAAWLSRMARTECPWVEARPDGWGGFAKEYRVTQFGKTDVDNRLPGVRLDMPWLPTYRAAEARPDQLSETSPNPARSAPNPVRGNR